MLYFLCNSLGGDFGVLGCRLLSEEKDMLPNDQGMIEEQRPVESDKDFGDMGRGWFWIQERPDIFFDVLNFDRKPLDFSAIVCWKTHPVQYFTVSFASIYSIWPTSWSMCEEHQQFVLPFHGSNLPKYLSRAEFVLHHLRYRALRFVSNCRSSVRRRRKVAIAFRGKRRWSWEKSWFWNSSEPGYEKMKT